MQEMDQRDRELLGALQGEIPLVSTPFAFLGQTLDMSEKEVIKRTERLERDGVFDSSRRSSTRARSGIASCLVAARVDPDRIDEAAAAINAHPGVTAELSPQQRLQSLVHALRLAAVEGRTGQVPSRSSAAQPTATACARCRRSSSTRMPRRTATSSSRARDAQRVHAAHAARSRMRPPAAAATCRLQPRPFDVLARTSPASARTTCSPRRARC